MMKLSKNKKWLASVLMVGLLGNVSVYAAEAATSTCPCTFGKKYMLAKDGYAAASGAIAVAGLGQVTKPGKLAVSVAGSTLKSAHATALGASYLSENSKILIKGAVTTNNRHHYGASLGATYTFD